MTTRILLIIISRRVMLFIYFTVSTYIYRAKAMILHCSSIHNRCIETS